MKDPMQRGPFLLLKKHIMMCNKSILPKPAAWLPIVATFLLLCCQGEPSTRKQAHKPTSRGLPFEMVMIVPRAAYEGELCDTLEAVFKVSTPLLPQHEPLFRVNVTYTDANLTPWRTFRNRLIIKIDKSLKQPAMGVARNEVALPQLEVMVEGPSTHILADFIGENRQRLTDLFVDAELEWEAAQLRRKHSKTTLEALRDVSGHTICVPTGLRASKRAKDFLWTGTNLVDKDQNFVFYSYPWNGQPLSIGQYVAKRDSAMKANIPGSEPNQWMQTACDPESRQPLVMSRTRILNKQYVLEVHGLWEMHNGALGGAFVALERIDSAHGLVLCTEGFIYSPQSPKRNLMREMEAALRTFR